MDDLVSTLTWVAAVGCGLNAGIFFIFSSTIMRSLRAQPAPSGIATMQSINDVILNPLFLLLFMGTTIVCTALAIFAPLSDQPDPVWRVMGAVAFVVGAFVVTMAFNVPLNNRLGEADPNSAEGAAFWSEYLRRWTAGNHVRAATSTAAAVILTLVARS